MIQNVLWVGSGRSTLLEYFQRNPSVIRMSSAKPPALSQGVMQSYGLRTLNLQLQGQSRQMGLHQSRGRPIPGDGHVSFGVSRGINIYSLLTRDGYHQNTLRTLKFPLATGPEPTVCMNHELAIHGSRSIHSPLASTILFGQEHKSPKLRPTFPKSSLNPCDYNF